MRSIVLAAVAMISVSACQPSSAPSSPKPQASTPAPQVEPETSVEPTPAPATPELPAIYANSPYKDNIAVANLNVGRPYALFREFLITDGWTTTESTKCLENVKHSNAQVLCQTVPELLNCSSENACNMLWVKKDGASVVVSVDGNMVDLGNKNPTSTLIIKKFTFFGISEKNQEVPDPAVRFEEQMRPLTPQVPAPVQQPITPGA